MYNNEYLYNNRMNNMMPNDGDRIFFPIFPFLLGGLAGGALVSASRPRPVFVNSPRPYPPYGGGYPPYRPYGNPGGYYNYQSGGYY